MNSLSNSGNRALASVLTLSLSLLAASCWFAENRASSNDRPTVDRGNDSGRRGGPARNNPQDRPGYTQIPTIADLDRQDFLPAEPEFQNTPKGLTLVHERRTSNRLHASTTRIRLSLPHRSPIGDPAGAASLCAEVAATAPQIRGKASLDHEIDRLGGKLSVRIDGSTTTFSIDVRTANWEESLQLLTEAIRNTATRRQIQVVRNRLLNDLESRTARDPLGLAVHQILTTRVLSRHPLDLMQDLPPDAVDKFRRDAYRPVGAVLAISSPHKANEVFRRAREALGTWYSEAPDNLAVATDLLDRQITIFWSPGAGDSEPSDNSLTPPDLQAALLFELTPLTIPNTIEFHVALEIFAAGPDSLLARQFRRRLGYDVPMRSEWIENGPAQIFVVRMPLASPEVVGQIQSAIDETLQQMTATLPAPPEIRDAAARVRLRLLRDQDRPSRSLIVLLRETMLNRLINAQLFTTPFRDLDSGVALDLDGAVDLLALRRPTIVVAGGMPPAALRDEVITLGTVIRGATGPDYGASPKEQREQALPFLRLAMNAVGGKRRLANFDSFSGQAHISTGRGPDAIDQIAFDQKSRRMRRIREVLGTRIDTLLEPDSATQQVGTKTVKLTPIEAKAMRNRIERHPLHVLGAVARSEATFRLLSIRRRAGRSLAVLEREESGSSRLRMHIDAESGLVRVIESTEQRPGIGPAAVTHEYRDYRNVRGLRAPFLVTQRIDDTDFGSVTRWLVFEPSTPPEIYFDRTVALPDRKTAALPAGEKE